MPKTMVRIRKNDNYDIDDPVHVRNFPQQPPDPEFDFIRNRERALMQTKPRTAEMRQRVKSGLTKSPVSKEILSTQNQLSTQILKVKNLLINQNVFYDAPKKQKKVLEDFVIDLKDTNKIKMQKLQ